MLENFISVINSLYGRKGIFTGFASEYLGCSISFTSLCQEATFI